jgi:hypothetical protein
MGDLTALIFLPAWLNRGAKSPGLGLSKITKLKEKQKK